MVPGRHIPTAETHQTEGSPSLKPERLPEPVPVCGGNAISPDLIRLQPGPAAAAPAAAQGPQRPQSRPGCPQCGLQTPKNLRGPGGSSLSVRSSKSKKSQRSKGGSKTTLNQPAENAPGDVCFDLLLSCLFCHCSALLLGLLDLCSSGFSSLCSGCAGGCADCCSAAVQDVPAEELSCHTHCHSVLVQSCCEPTEFLEFCLECCQICHRS